ncbi:hypothetical protein ACLM5J_00230 [Nocardioides sp. Bht2]|uniref:hypothetical protein n=1 Tax=Nocardioides sp. Bht2 TaxID=3392297 RepID=UPI0039B6C077
MNGWTRRSVRAGLVALAAVLGLGLATSAAAQDGPATVVTPVAPQVRAIDGCGSYGFVGMLGGEGIAYRLTEGNGREGEWEVRAEALPGYQLEPAAVHRWGGDLGGYRPCAGGSDTDASSASADGAASSTWADDAAATTADKYSERGEQALHILAAVFGVIALVCGSYLVVLERRRRSS